VRAFLKWSVFTTAALGVPLWVTWPLIERDWKLILADFPAGSADASGVKPTDKCFELIHVNPPRGYAYIFDACRGSVQQVLVPLPPLAPERPQSTPEVAPGNPKVGI
jgi:hypothetical protein